MMKLNVSQCLLLEKLSDGFCHSGNELGKILGVSRSAVWKHIKHLIDLGVPIISKPQQGYQLKHPLILLNEQRISNSLDIPVAYKLHIFSSIDSTNRYLKELPLSSELEICCAELQTHGRGRFGRQWHSPFGENIYCSSRWSLHCDLSRLSGLSLVSSLAVRATLNEFCPSFPIKIKWPNDILWRGKKLCGSLIEIIAESNASANVIIGIGLNVNSDTQNNPLPDQPWCSLYELSQKYYDRNKLIAVLIGNLEHYLTRFIENDLSVFMEEWQEYDYLAGKQITVTQSLETLSGIAHGINTAGQLILQDGQGTIHYLSSGDTSLHTNQNYLF